MNVELLTRVLFRKSDTEIATIRAQAEQVALGFVSSISALSQSTSFNTNQAMAVLDAIEKITSARETNPDACYESAGEAAMGHSLRFQPAEPPQGVTWGP